jgi:3',5'-cyclic AMP phosphodiesterase CpdA
MIIGQITDTHVLPEGRKLGNLIDTNAQLEAAVCLLNRLSTPPDAVLVTGDLTDDGECESYAVLRARLAALDSPFYLIPGNHDRRQALVDAFPDHAYLPRTGFLQYAIEDHAVRLIALDTLVEGSEDGALCEERLAWLDAALAAEPDRPALVFMHHPPFESGIWWMDAMGLSGARGLRAVLGRHPQVRLVVCGHVHRPFHSALGSAPVAVAPSTAWQVHLDLVPESPPRAALEPAAAFLHVWNGDAFVTHTSYLIPDAKPLDLSAMLGDWPRVLDRLRRQKAALESDVSG